MLVLSRSPGDAVQIGVNIFVRILSVHGSCVRLGFEAPAEIPIIRTEVRLAGKIRNPRLQQLWDTASRATDR